jgi:ATP synthase I chain
MSEETKPIVVETSAVEKRLWRLLLFSLAVEIVLSLILADWQFTAGVAIGGSLAIINFRMLQNSVRGIFQSESNAFAIKFFLRYVIIGLVVWIFYLLKTVSVIGILLGISSFVGALMLEAVIQFYFVIIKNEEI